MPASMLARHTSPARLIALGLAVAAGVSGCGGGRTVRIDGHQLALRLDEYRIVPQSVSVPAGRLRIVARNSGILTHNVAVELGYRGAGGSPIILGQVRTLHPGASGASKQLNLRPGRYVLASTVANQADLGMTGTLIVRP
jgi:hypothetical protein